MNNFKRKMSLQNLGPSPSVSRLYNSYHGFQRSYFYLRGFEINISRAKGARMYSIRSEDSSPIINPELVYKNVDTQKLDILLDNKNKSGIYR
jgi:hypothetical protein